MSSAPRICDEHLLLLQPLGSHREVTCTNNLNTSGTISRVLYVVPKVTFESGRKFVLLKVLNLGIVLEKRRAQNRRTATTAN